ncbi:MAG TPA: ABC transporter permease [Thermoanaerobaculia bacterium]|nr:ABC transporter permease [Thermoanaerobaculia bacterium]
MSSDKRPLAHKLFLLKEMVIRDMKSRYAGSGLGVAWAFANPILWMLLYTLVFSLILRVPSPPGFAGFPEFLLAGLLPWMAIQEGVSRSATALTDNASMVKKTVFPIETLVLSIVLAALVNQLIAFLVFGAYLAAIGHLSLPWALLAIPALAVQAALTFGLGCLVATVATFFRDAIPLVSIALTVVFYATPVVYPAELVPPRLHFLVDANPFAHLTAWYRDAFTLHRLPDAGSVLFTVLFAAAAMAAGSALFRRARPHFADLI